jgi:hypothetical protein
MTSPKRIAYLLRRICALNWFILFFEEKVKLLWFNNLPEGVAAQFYSGSCL